MKARTTTAIVACAILFVLSGGVWAGPSDPVHFNDANLKQAVKAALGITHDPTEGEMASPTFIFFDGQGYGITDLTGLEYATNLTGTWLNNNQISDLSPLAGLTKLENLGAYRNQISDLSPLVGSTNLLYLDLPMNQISDLSPLAGVTELRMLNVGDNQISDLSYLVGLTDLWDLNLDGNPLHPDACTIYIPQLESQGTTVYHDACWELVPNVVGMSLDDAQNAIWNAGLNVAIVYAAHSEPYGQVIAQEPELVPPDTPASVWLTVSSGPAGPGQVQVPDVVGMAQADAESAITAAGLVAGTVTQAASSTVGAGSVISQEPVAGTSVAAGSAVNLVISSGALIGPLVAHWKLDETSGTVAADSSGNKCNGTLLGGALWQPTSGQLGGAVQLDGVNDYVDCGNPAALNIQDRITLACWIKIASFTRPWQAILAKGDDSYRLCRASIGESVHVGLGGTSLGEFDGAAVVTDNEWHHIATTYDGAEAMLYMDGVLDTAIPATGQINASSYNLFLGENSQMRGRYWKGMMDDVRIYNVALGEAEVLAAMLGADGCAAGPVAHWMLDEAAGTAAADCSGNNCDGIVSGGALWQPTGGRIGGALQFDGVNDYIDCGNPSVLDIQDQISLASWIKIASFTRPWQVILAKGNDSYGLCRASLGDSVHMALGGTSVGGFDGAAVVTDSEWHHIAGTYDGAEAMLYMDGVLDTIVPATGQIALSSHNLFIGENSQARGRYWKGLLDDVRIYGCALSEADVAELAGATAPVGPVQVAVPNVVGMTQAAGESAITAAGLIVGTVTQAASNTVPAGSVISQSPVGGTSAAVGSAVDLVVSSGPSGPAQVTVPDVKGMTQAAAESAITSAGLVVGTITETPISTVPQGNVFTQNPAPGTLVARGTAVNLLVSSGPPQVQVPDVVGMAQAAAESAITSAGLVVGTVTQASSNTVPQGSVISQNPAAGTSVASGSAVNLVISSGPPAEPPDGGLVAHWKLDETSGTIANDSAGTRHGTTYGSPTWQPAGGQIAGAIKLDGNDDSVSLPIGVLISSLTNSTFAIWVNWSGGGSNDFPSIFDFSRGAMAYMYLTPNDYLKNALCFVIRNGASSTAEDTVTAAQKLGTGWHHVAVTIDAASKMDSLYLDGLIVATRANMQHTPSSLGNTTDNYLGYCPDPSVPPFNGSLDDFRIYDRALTPQEIQQCMLGAP